MSLDVARLTAALAHRYRIERELGEGGMATVYLAGDLKHDRQVALKVLKPELAAVVGGDRFISEIKTTANLQHPHILPLFDSGEADGFLFYVMPYVEGETLREKLDREKQLPVGEAIAIATKIAGALQTAHDEGVIHRDIKPANILLQRGEPVVADFGIALAVSEAGGGRLTETGLSLGTPYYMAPEQATADRDPDARSDIYSLACLTYEMLAGEPPFTGSSAQAVLGRILTQPPPHVTAERSSVPHNVDAAILQALQKLPADRFESVAAFASALNDSTYMGPAGRASGAVPGRVDGPVRRGASRLAWPAVAVLLAALAAWGWTRGGSGGSEAARPVHFEAVPDAIDILQVAGRGSPLAISPDGGALAYISYASRGLPTILVRDLDTLEPREVGSGQYTGIAISPDGRSVLAVGAGRLQEIPISGGPARTIAEDLGAFVSVSVTPDGSLVYPDSAGTMVRWSEMDGPRPIETDAGPLTGLLSLLISEDGHTGVGIDRQSAGEAGLILVDLRTGERTRLGSGVPFAYRDGIVAWRDFAGSGFYAQRLDIRERVLAGSPVALLDTRLSSAGALSANGDLAYVSEGVADGEVVRLNREGVRTELGVSATAELGVRVSTDGRYAVFDQGFSSQTTEVYLADLETGIRRRVTFDGGLYPSITPDGERIIYYRNVDGDYALYVRNLDGSGEEQVLLDPESATVDVAPIPGTNRILVREGDQARLDGSDIVAYRVGDPDSRIVIAGGPGNQLSPAVSPNGRYVAYSADNGGDQPNIFVRSLENPAEFRQLSEGGGSEPAWSTDGTELYYRAAAGLIAVPVDTESATFRRTGPAETLFELGGLVANQNRTAYGVAEDGFYFISSATGSINVILNWWDEVERRVGAR